MIEENLTVKSCEVILTSAEANALSQEFYEILNEFSEEGYNGWKFNNPIMAKAFNKVYSTLTGGDHPAIIKNLEALSNGYYSGEDRKKYDFINRFYEIEKNNIPTMSLKINVDGEEKQILFNSAEEEYLIEEINSLKKYCEYHPGERYKKLITDEITISSIEKMYNAMMNSKEIQISASDIYNSEKRFKR